MKLQTWHLVAIGVAGYLYWRSKQTTAYTVAKAAGDSVTAAVDKFADGLFG